MKRNNIWDEYSYLNKFLVIMGLQNYLSKFKNTNCHLQLETNSNKKK